MLFTMEPPANLPCITISSRNASSLLNLEPNSKLCILFCKGQFGLHNYWPRIISGAWQRAGIARRSRAKRAGSATESSYVCKTVLTFDRIGVNGALKFQRRHLRIDTQNQPPLAVCLTMQNSWLVVSSFRLVHALLCNCQSFGSRCRVI